MSERPRHFEAWFWGVAMAAAASAAGITWAVVMKTHGHEGYESAVLFLFMPYRSSLDPEFYWELWNRLIVRGVQMRVMNAIKSRAEMAKTAPVR